MKKILNFSLTCMVLMPLYAMTACSEKDGHIAKINLVNDLGKPVEISLCDDFLRCEFISRTWPAKTIGIKDTQAVTVSNEVASVFRVSSKTDEKTNVQCLRVQLNKSVSGYQNILLSSAKDC